MRLEFEPSVTALPLVENEIFEDIGLYASPDTTALVKKGISAAQKGDRDRAHLLLSQAADADPRCEDAWMWLASISEYPEEQLALLDRVLELNPDNGKAGEWRVSAKSVMAKTFVQRAIEANANGDATAAQSNLDLALQHDERCEMAWFWNASLAGNDDVKVECLNKVLAINPDNRDAEDALKSIEKSRVIANFANAKTAAVGGDRDKALTLVDEFLRAVPDNAEAWILRSHLSPELPDKLESLAKALEIDPNNAAARTGYDFLSATLSGNDVPAAAADDAIHRTEEPAVSEPEAAAEDAVALTSFSRVETDAHEQEIEENSPFLELAIDTIQADETAKVESPCPFCEMSNDAHAFACSGCSATLKLADLDTLLTNRRPDVEAIRPAVTEMEAEWNLREFNEDELTALAIGHFNLGNLEKGLAYLQEATRLSPDDLILTSQTNAIAIRLEEMGLYDENQDPAPVGKTILVVDDSPTVRKLIAGKLEKSGHNVICAVDGVEALERIGEQLPDLVLLDITMPRMDGYEVCREIRANPAAKDLPVVMISGKDGFFDKVRGRMAGTTGYVTKPFGPETLMKALETYLAPVEAD